ncbi:MAG TPA: GAF domain-containing protein [Chryseosolibacter sp.]
MSPQTQTATVVSEEQLKPFITRIHEKADRINTGFMIGFFGVGILLSFFYQTLALGILMGGLSLATFLGVRYFYAGSFGLRLLTSFLYWNFGLQFLLQMHGMYEMKFIFFIALTVLLFYEDWRVVLPATIYAIVTLSFIFLFRDNVIVQTYFADSTDVSMTHFLIHIFSIAFYSGLCMWWALLQHEQTRESALAAIESSNQLKMMDVNISFADHISQGNLKAEYGSDKADTLGQSLLNMRESLIRANEREEREKFTALGLAKIGEILRQNADNLETLCDKVIEEVVKYMKANQGSMFVRESHGDDEKLVLMAARAWNRKKFIQKTVDIGEGLVGQAAIEKQTIFMTKVPNNYVTISSGLGEANPRCILIVPLKAEEEVVGVIELASFSWYEEFEIKFLEKVGESIAATILTTRNNQRNKELLAKSNELAEQMRSQEEEIRQNMEEMQATQEEMHRKNSEIERLLKISNEKEAELEQQLSEIQKVKKESDVRNQEMIAYMENYKKTLLKILDELPHKIFLKDGQGKMVLVNTVVAKAHNMTIDELIGKSDFDFVDAKTAQDWRNQELEIIRKGSETYIFNETLSGETKRLKSTKMAFYIPHLKETGLLGIQTDVTELEKLKELVKEPVKA